MAASDFVFFKSTRKEIRLLPNVKCLPNLVEVRMKPFIKKDDFVYCVHYYSLSFHFMCAYN